MRKLRGFGLLLILGCWIPAGGRCGDLKLGEPSSNIWQARVGEGFSSSAHTVSLEIGAVKGLAILGSRQAHDLALSSLSYGHMLGHVVGEGHFYCGNFELRAELIGGVEFLPSSEWVIGVAPHLRYS